MITTGLPFDFEKLDEIQRNGAIVMMKNLDFSSFTVDDPIFTALIYLRNVNCNNLILDFTDVTYENKEKILLLFLTEDIMYDSGIFISTWYKIFFNYLNADIDCLSFLTADEIKQFISKHDTLISNALSLLYSAPLFLIYSLKNNFIDDVEKDDSIPINSNLTNIIKNNNYIQLIYILQTSNIKYKNFTKIFIQQNINLFDVLRTSLFGFSVFVQLNA